VARAQAPGLRLPGAKWTDRASAILGPPCGENPLPGRRRFWPRISGPPRGRSRAWIEGDRRAKLVMSTAGGLVLGRHQARTPSCGPTKQAEQPGAGNAIADGRAPERVSGGAVHGACIRVRWTFAAAVRAGGLRRAFDHAGVFETRGRFDGQHDLLAGRHFARTRTRHDCIRKTVIRQWQLSSQQRGDF